MPEYLFKISKNQLLSQQARLKAASFCLEQRSVEHFFHHIKTASSNQPIFFSEVKGNSFYPSAIQRYPALCEWLS